MDFLPADRCALIAQDLVSEGWCQVVQVRVGRGPCDDDIIALSSQKLPNDGVGLWRGGTDQPRVCPQAHTEHEQVEGLVCPLPCRQLVQPSTMELGPAEPFWLLGCYALDGRAVDHFDLDLGPIVGLDQCRRDHIDQA